MGVKYTIPFKSQDDKTWRIDILLASWSDAPISVRGQGGQAVTLQYDPAETYDPFSPYIKSTLSIKLYNEDQINVREIQRAQDKEFIIKLYRQNALYWQGYIQPEGTQRQLAQYPYDVELMATDGLNMLETIPYVYTPLPGLDEYVSKCPINYVRDVLFNNLGISLPIRWTNSIKNSLYVTDDVMAGRVQWSPYNEGIYSYQSGSNGDQPGPNKSCAYVLFGIMASFQCRIYQANGRWNIRRINDLVNAINVPYKQISTSQFQLVIQSGTENLLNQVGRTGYRFLETSKPVITTLMGAKTVRVIYNANVRDNILPNGNQDQVIPTSLGLAPLYWGEGGGTNKLLITSELPLDGRDGYSTQVWSPDFLAGNKYYTLLMPDNSYGVRGLPIDTKTNIKKINFGFTFSPEVGFPTTVPGGDVINWDSNPFLIQVTFISTSGVPYYLNEFGFWQEDETTISIKVEGLSIGEVARVDFDKFRGIIMPETPVQPTPDEQSSIIIAFMVKPTQKYNLDNIYINIDSGDEVYEATYEGSLNTKVEERPLDISSSFGGYMLSNYMTKYSESGSEFYFRDGFAYEGSLTKLTANSIMRFRYKASDIFSGVVRVFKKDWSFDELYLIDTYQQQRFLGISASYNIETCQLNLTAMECRNDNVIFTEKFYNSNDNQLSN